VKKQAGFHWGCRPIALLRCLCSTRELQFGIGWTTCAGSSAGTGLSTLCTLLGTPAVGPVINTFCSKLPKKGHPTMLNNQQRSDGRKGGPYCAKVPLIGDYRESYPIAIQSYLLYSLRTGRICARLSYQI